MVAVVENDYLLVLDDLKNPRGVLQEGRGRIASADREVDVEVVQYVLEESG